MLKNLDYFFIWLLALFLVGLTLASIYALTLEVINRKRKVFTMGDRFLELVRAYKDGANNLPQLAEAFYLTPIPSVERAFALLGRKSKKKTVLVAFFEKEGVIASIIGRLEDRRYWVRASCAYSLGIIGSKTAVLRLIDHLHDLDSDVRLKAAEALGNIGDLQAVPCLIEVLDDPHWGEQRFVVQAILKFGEQAKANLIRELEKNTNRFADFWICQILGELKAEEAVALLIERLITDKSPDVRARAAEALGKINDPAAIDAIEAACDDSVWFVRAQAAHALGRIGLNSERSVSVLVDLLGDENWWVRDRATSSLMSAGKRPLLVNALQKGLLNEDKKIVAKSAELLGRLKSKDSINRLIDLLADTSSDVRANVAEALGEMDDARAVHHLMSLLHDPVWYVRARSAKALGELGDSAAVGSLTELSESANWWVKQRVDEAIAKINEKDAA